MANPTMTLIVSNTVGSGGVSSVTFSSIPATYTDLVVKASTRSAGGGIGTTRAQFNSDTSATYSIRYLQGDGSSATSVNASGIPNTYNQTFLNDGNTSTSNIFSNGELYIPNYASSNQKSWSSDSIEEENATAAYSRLTAGLWTGTATISSITFFNDSGNFAQYSTFYLYGISKS
jgi:hypothetical protein